MLPSVLISGVWSHIGGKKMTDSFDMACLLVIVLTHIPTCLLVYVHQPHSYQVVTDCSV